jgi:hypothetical protein
MELRDWRRGRERENLHHIFSWRAGAINTKEGQIFNQYLEERRDALRTGLRVHGVPNDSFVE